MPDPPTEIERRRKALEERGIRARSYGDYARRVFNNFYNYTALTGVVAASAITGDWWLCAVALGVEALWMLYAPDSKLVRKRLDAEMDREDAVVEARERDLMLGKLGARERHRCSELMRKHEEISRLASENPSLGVELLRPEISKMQMLVDSFVELALTSARCVEYLKREDVGEIEAQKRRYEDEVKNEKSHSSSDLGRKNLNVLLRRIERLREIRDFVERARKQLDLIENSFGLLADHIVSMRSPGELAMELDELLDGVEAVRETAREADHLLGPTSISA